MPVLRIFSHMTNSQTLQRPQDISPLSACENTASERKTWWLGCRLPQYFLLDLIWLPALESQECQCRSVGEDGCPAQAEGEFTLPPPFVLDDAHLRQWRWSFLHLLMQMLTSSRNALTVTLRNNILPAICASLSPVQLAHKVHQRIS